MTRTSDHRVTHHGCSTLLITEAKQNANHSKQCRTVLTEDDQDDDDGEQGMHQKLAAFYIHFVLISRSRR